MKKNIFSLIIILLILAKAGHAQTTNKIHADTSKKAKTIDPIKMSQIRDIISTGNVDVKKLMTDTSIAPAQRMARYRQLILIRTAKIDSILGRKNKRVYSNPVMNPSLQH
ncbi:MAG: hypothetical protein ABIN91_19065 [Mucilaginibacter sp.]|uniref:hypothetical protein n=1 Tax=Mucilaginibacter sp. TaxID=1882438 RepID=UPI003266380D